MPTSSLTPSVSSSAFLLAQELSAAGHWEWIAKLLPLVGDQITPTQVLQLICTHPSGGGLVAEDLGLAALDQGGDAGVLVMGAEGRGTVLAYAAIHGQKKLLQRLLKDVRASDWLLTPVGEWPLLHALMRTSASWEIIEHLMNRGLPIVSAADGSASWEHRLPGQFSSDSVLDRLRALGLLPTTHEELAAGSDRCRRRASRGELAEVERSLAKVAQASGIDLSESQRQQALANHLLGLTPVRSSYATAISVPLDLADQLRSLSFEQWSQPITLDLPRPLAGTWSTAGAMAWAQLLTGPLSNAFSGSRTEVPLASLDLTQPLASWSRNHPGWTSFLGKPKQELSLLGLVALEKVERTLAKADGTARGAATAPIMAIFQGDLSRGDAASFMVKAAQGSLRHLGSHRRTELAKILFPLLLDLRVRERSAKACAMPSLLELTDAERLRLTLSLVGHRQAIAADGQRREFWRLLTRATPEVIKAFTLDDWRTLRRWVAENPEVVLPSWDTAIPTLFDHLPSALTAVSPGLEPKPMGGPSARAPWLAPKSRFLEQVLGSDLDIIPGRVFVNHWAKMMTQWCDSHAGQFAHEDRLAGLAEAFSRIQCPVPALHAWGALRDLARQGRPLSLSEDAKACLAAEVCDHPTGPASTPWATLASLWEMDVATGHLDHPWTRFTQLGLNPSPGWCTRILSAARASKRPSVATMEAIERERQGALNAPKTPKTASSRSRMRT